MIRNLDNSVFFPTETATMGSRGRSMAPVLQLSGSFIQQHLETVSQGTAFSTPQGMLESLVHYVFDLIQFYLSMQFTLHSKDHQ